MSNKYKLTNETIVFEGRLLHRIQAVKAFRNIEKGELGGYVESEDNLSQDGLAWIDSNAKVYDKARVFNNAQVVDDAQVYDTAVIGDNARVSGESVVRRNARVFGSTIVGENAEISGEAKVYGQAIIRHRAHVYGDAEVYENAKVSGNVRVLGRAKVRGMSLVTDDATVRDEVIVENLAIVGGFSELSGNMRATKKTLNLVGLIYKVTFSDEHIKVGCEVRTIEGWLALSESELYGVHYAAHSFYHKYNNILLELANLHQNNS